MREIFAIDHLPNRTITHNGQAYLFFSGTAYLGLPQHPAFQQLTVDALSRYGTVFGSSRNGNLRLRIYEEAEAKLAALVSAGTANPATALTLSSGMIAGQVVVNWLRAQSSSFLYAPNAHPALWHDPGVTLPTLSMGDWAAQLPDQIQTVPPGPVAILTNSVDAVGSRYYDFDWIHTLPTDRPLTLVVDDSHGLGVLNHGRGIWPQLNTFPHRTGEPIRLLVTASLAKAMGMPGGAIFGDVTTIETVRQTAFFGACSPLPPAYLEAYVRADALYTEGRERLRQNLRLAEELLLPTGLFRQAPGYPVFFTEHDDLYGHLLRNGILIYSFAYPTTADRANTRIVISAFHTAADIQQLAQSVHDFKRLAVWRPA